MVGNKIKRPFLLLASNVVTPAPNRFGVKTTETVRHSDHQKNIDATRSSYVSDELQEPLKVISVISSSLQHTKLTLYQWSTHRP